MAVTDYSLKAFIEDLRRITDQVKNESAMLEQMAPLAQRAALSAGWRREEHYEADPELGFGSTLLHVEPDDSLLIVADSWLPGRGINAHDHGTWALVVGVDGCERNIFWERIDDGRTPGYAELRQTGERIISAGEVLLVPTGIIHSVINDGSSTSLSFHVYGHHLNGTGRLQFDPTRKTARPFLLDSL